MSAVIALSAVILVGVIVITVVIAGMIKDNGGLGFKEDTSLYSRTDITTTEKTTLINWDETESASDTVQQNPTSFNFSTEDSILRWIRRGDTIYDVIIPDNAEVILCNEEKGIYRSNKIIVTNPRELTDEVIIDLYNKTTLSNKVLAQCLQVLLWKRRLEISKFIINDRVNKENVDEFIFEFEKHVKKSEIFCYDELSSEAKVIYDLLLDVKNK